MEHFRVRLICEQSKNIVGHLMDNKGKEKKKNKYEQIPYYRKRKRKK